MNEKFFARAAVLVVLSACSSEVAAPAPAPAPSASTALAPTAAPTFPAPLPVVPGTTAFPPATPAPAGTTPPYGTPTTGCTPNPGDVCDQCLSTSCCQAVLACENNADCVAIDQCSAQCHAYGATPQADQCYQACDNQHPAGLQILLQLYQCMETACAAPCK